MVFRWISLIGRSDKSEEQKSVGTRGKRDNNDQNRVKLAVARELAQLRMTHFGKLLSNTSPDQPISS
jgi:hypothetical protein